MSFEDARASDVLIEEYWRNQVFKGLDLHLSDGELPLQPLCVSHAVSVGCNKSAPKTL
jgi:hypothetical protein